MDKQRYERGRPVDAPAGSRANVRVEYRRADQLCLGDRIIEQDWRGTPFIAYVTGLSKEGDDVVVRTNEGEFTTSEGNEVVVVTPRPTL